MVNHQPAIDDLPVRRLALLVEHLLEESMNDRLSRQIRNPKSATLNPQSRIASLLWLTSSEVQA